VLAAEHLFDFGRLHFDVEAVERLGELTVHLFALLGPFTQHRQVLGPSPERHDEIAILFEPSAALQNPLRFDLVFPEVRGDGASFESGQFFGGFGGLKDSSADRQRVCSNLRNVF
jgi:hypothetical protein